MMLSEFIERTGFEPTADEYQKIEEAYYNFDGDKNDFRYRAVQCRGLQDQQCAAPHRRCLRCLFLPTVRSLPAATICMPDFTI